MLTGIDSSKGDSMNPKTTKPEKLPYKPPKATFVPLKLEERLLICSKIWNLDFGCVVGNPSS